MNRLDMEDMGDRIQSFKTDIRFPLIDPPDNITEIITKVSNGTTLKALSGIELQEYAIILSSYALYLSMQENQIEAKFNWAENNIKFIVGKNLQEVEGYGFNEKDSYIRANEPTAVTLHDKKLEFQAKKESIKFIAMKIHNLADHLRSLGLEKTKERRYSQS